MANINYGSGELYVTTGNNRSTLSTLSASKFIIMFASSTNSYHGYAKIGTITGNTVTFGGFYKFLAEATNFDTTSNKYVAALTDSKAVLVYRRASGGNLGQAIIADITGTTIAYGSEYEFSDSALFHVAVARLNDTQFVVAYQNSSFGNLGMIRIGTVDGTTITYGTAVFLVDNDNSAEYMSIVALNDSKFVVGFSDGNPIEGDDDYGTVRIGTVSGDSISLGSSYQFNDTNEALWNSIDVFDESSFVITYTDFGDGSKGKANIGVIDGTTITFGSSELFFDGPVNYATVSVLDQNSFVVTYRNKDDSNKGQSKVGHRYGSQIIGFGPISEYFSGSVAYNNSDTLDGSKIIVSYANLDSNADGMVKVGEIEGTFHVDTMDLFVGSPIIPISNSGSLFINGLRLINDSANLFIGGQEPINNSVNLYTFAPPPDMYKSMTLYITTPEQIMTSGDLFINGCGFTSNSSDLFVNGFKSISNSGNLFIGGILDIVASGNLFVNGGTYVDGSVSLFTIAPPPDLYKSATLYIKGPEPISDFADLFTQGVFIDNGSVSLYTHGSIGVHIIDSINLFIEGSAIPTSGDLAKPFDWLLKSQDHNPQIIGTLSSASTVNIQVWDVTGGQNLLMDIDSSGCYAIGNTGRWGWSTRYLPSAQGYAKHYFYLMTSDASETFDGQFILDVPEYARWILPRDNNTFLV